MAKQPPAQPLVAVTIDFEGHWHEGKPVPVGTDIQVTPHEAEVISKIKERRANGSAAGGCVEIKRIGTEIDIPPRRIGARQSNE